MEDEGIVAILGLILLQSGGEIRIPMEAIVKGLPSYSGVQVFPDEAKDELVIRISTFEDADAE